MSQDNNEFATSNLHYGTINVLGGLYTKEEAARLITELAYLVTGVTRKTYPTARVFLHEGIYSASDLMKIFDEQNAQLRASIQPTQPQEPQNG